jgi:hypothetical protein
MTIGELIAGRLAGPAEAALTPDRQQVRRWTRDVLAAIDRRVPGLAAEPASLLDDPADDCDCGGLADPSCCCMVDMVTLYREGGPPVFVEVGHGPPGTLYVYISGRAAGGRSESADAADPARAAEYVAEYAG